MKSIPGLSFGDRTSATTANGKPSGHPMDMHYRNATLCFNRERAGYMIPGEVTGLPRVMYHSEAVDYIKKMARLMDN